MKILQIFGAVVAIHLLAFIFIFASPGCQSSPRSVPTPDATVPTAAPAPDQPAPAVSYQPVPPAVALVPGRAVPTRPGSPNAAALAPAKPAVSDVAPVSTYTVQKGDSLWSIAKKHHLTVPELAKVNNLGVGAPLQPGKKLLIPGKPASAPAQEAAAVPAPVEPKTPVTVGEAGTHLVQPGEKLGTIARKYQVTVGDLAKANSITDPAKIRVGQRLVIPGRAGAAKAAAKPAAPAVDKPAAAPTAPEAAPHFEIKAPPPGQDLDAGLKSTTSTEVPTVKVDEAPGTEEPPKK